MFIIGPAEKFLQLAAVLYRLSGIVPRKLLTEYIYQKYFRL